MGFDCWLEWVVAIFFPCFVFYLTSPYRDSFMYSCSCKTGLDLYALKSGMQITLPALHKKRIVTYGINWVPNNISWTELSFCTPGLHDALRLPSLRYCMYNPLPTYSTWRGNKVKGVKELVQSLPFYLTYKLLLKIKPLLIMPSVTNAEIQSSECYRS